MLEVSIIRQFPLFTLETSFSLGKETMLLCSPSGSGKTTLLRCLAGLERPDSGHILLNGRLLFHERGVNLPASLRSIALMSQDNTLFPHLTVGQNLLYSLARNDNTPPLYYELLRKLNLTAYEQCYPETLSGGEKRRVNLGRTLMRRPDLLLLDEPFSGLDDVMCGQVAALLEDYCLRHRPVTLVATHIRQELLGWANFRLNLSNGKSAQAS